MHVQSCINNLGDIYSFGPVFRSKLYKPTFIHNDIFFSDLQNIDWFATIKFPSKPYQTSVLITTI